MLQYFMMSTGHISAYFTNKNWLTFFINLIEYLVSQTIPKQRHYKFWYLKTPHKIWIKRFKKYSLREFWIMKVLTGLFSFCRFCQPWFFCSEGLQKYRLCFIRIWDWIRVQFVNDVKNSLSNPQNQINFN